MAVPHEVLKDFLKLAQEQLEKLEIDSVLSPSAIRSLLLERQLEVLHQIVTVYNATTSSPSALTVQCVQEALKNIPDSDTVLVRLSKHLDETARFEYAKLTLYSACRRISEQTLRDKMKLKASGIIKRNDLIDFFAIYRTGVRLPCVQKWLASQTETIFADLPPPSSSSKTTSPQQRLKDLQALFLGELGYDIDFVEQEIKRIFFSAGSNEFSGDQELADTFTLTTIAMNEAARTATAEASVAQFSDIDKGGVTRVIAIDYYDNIDAGSPQRQAMVEQDEEQQKQSLHLASQAATLQQEIVQELMALSEEDRKVQLAEAKRVSDDMMRRVMQKSPSERIQVFTSIDEPTQRLMAMHKLWEGVVVANRKNKSSGEQANSSLF